MISFERSVFFKTVEGGYIATLPSPFPLVPAANVFVTEAGKGEILARSPDTTPLREGLLAGLIVTVASVIVGGALIGLHIAVPSLTTAPIKSHALFMGGYLLLGYGLLVAGNLYRTRRLRPYFSTLPKAGERLGILEACLARLQAHSPRALRTFMAIDALLCLSAITELPSPMAIVSMIVFGGFGVLTFKAYRDKLASAPGLTS